MKSKADVQNNSTIQRLLSFNCFLQVTNLRRIGSIRSCSCSGFGWPSLPFPLDWAPRLYRSLSPHRTACCRSQTNLQHCSLDNMKIKKTRCCLNLRNRLILFCNQRELADENYLKEQRVTTVIAFGLLIGSLLSGRN